MLLLVSSERFLEHATPAGHPECPDRLRAVTRALSGPAWSGPDVLREEAPPAGAAALARVHDPGYIEQVRAFCAAGGGALDADTHAVPASWDAADRAAGAALRAVEFVCRNEGRCAFAAVRPPGHHALYKRPMGFCLFNNIAVAAAAARAVHGLERILIVDWDLHHGNGTQELFYADPGVFYFSMHRFPFWPGSGSAQETGSGAGAGFTLNLPLPAQTLRAEIRARFRASLQQIAARFRPQVVLISAGFDMHRLDPLGGLALEAADFAAMTHEVAELFLKTDAHGIVSCLEGGYHLDALGQSVEAHVRALRDIAPQD